ncbi:MAG TPA: hypothetical protein VIG33_12265 [Pseudobdellovibrionaceae bacterium]|jgi:hypothetical protein
MQRSRRTNLLVAGLFGFLSSTNLAWGRSMPSMRTLPETHPTFSYDISASSGTENSNTYSELKLNLNWYLNDWLNWRNGIFSRFGSNIQAVNGLDSSLLAAFDTSTEGDQFGVQVFAGPGVRMASADNSAVTAEAGIIFKLGGISLGGGAKYLSYFSTRKDLLGIVLPKDETQYFIVLSGSGSF